MRTRKRAYAIGLLSAVVLAAGCSASSASLAPAPSTTASSAAIATAHPASSPVPGAERAGNIVVTAVDGVRVRSQPRVSDDSIKEEPLLPRGTALYVVD